MRNVHLLVLIHGMWGNPEHLAEMSRIIKETKGSVDSGSEDAELDVLVAQSNRDESTYDGIDWGGERVADEVSERVERIEEAGGKLTKLSVAGYSLGGLVARFLIGILHQRNLFASVQPVNFSTFATPHIGLLRNSSFRSSLLAALGPKLLSRTGEQFYAVDDWGPSGRSLLELMADQKEIFYQALSLFAHIHIYGNAVNDTTVPYATALLDTADPFVNHEETGINVEFDPKYDPIITSYSIPEVPPVRAPKPKPLSPAWFGSMQPTRYLPPPLRSLKLPYQVAATLFIPVLFPTFLTLVLIRLTLHTRSSRARIRLLEGDEKLKESKLVHVFARLEREIEGAVVEMVEDGAPSEDEAEVSLAGSPHEKYAQHDSNSPEPEAKNPASPSSSGSKEADSREKPAKGQPILTPAQHEMVRSLNALPRLAKHAVFINPSRNSHATIVARDVKNFEFHRRGWGVLQHWADAFEL